MKIKTLVKKWININLTNSYQNIFGEIKTALSVFRHIKK